MAEYCTCGAMLPPDARFCHKCGKPQREEPLIQAEEPAPETVTPPPIANAPVAAPAGPLPITFHNPIAVRVSLFAAGLISMLILAPLPLVITLLWRFIAPIVGGFLAAYLYTRRTGQSITVIGGARIGWITGIFSFVIMMVLSTINIAVLASGQGIAEVFRQAAQQTGTPDVSGILQTTEGQVIMILTVIGFLFVSSAILPILGGVLGAKVLEKD